MISSSEPIRQGAPALPLTIIIILSVSCSALGQVALKYGMSAESVQRALGTGDARGAVLASATSPGVLLGFSLYGLSAIMWSYVLARLDVSVAYAFVALGFVLTMALGCLWLGEPFTARKLAGTLFVMLGIWLVSTAR
jgi:multidrug transporter EmrE-like cation transporter